MQFDVDFSETIDIPDEEIKERVAYNYTPWDIWSPEFLEQNFQLYEHESVPVNQVKKQILTQVFTLEEIEDIKRECEYVLKHYKR